MPSSWSLVGSLQKQVCLPRPDPGASPWGRGCPVNTQMARPYSSCKAWSETSHAIDGHGCASFRRERGRLEEHRRCPGGDRGAPPHPVGHLGVSKELGSPRGCAGLGGRICQPQWRPLVLSHGPPLPHVADLPPCGSLPGGLLGLLPRFRDPVPGADSVPRGQVSRAHGRLNLPTVFFSRRGEPHNHPPPSPPMCGVGESEMLPEMEKGLRVCCRQGCELGDYPGFP